MFACGKMLRFYVNTALCALHSITCVVDLVLCLIGRHCFNLKLVITCYDVNFFVRLCLMSIYKLCCIYKLILNHVLLFFFDVYLMLTM